MIPKRDLTDILGVNTGGPAGRRTNEPGHSTNDYLKFKDLVEGMLTFDPSKRLVPILALQLPFFVQTSDENTATYNAFDRNNAGNDNELGSGEEEVTTSEKAIQVDFEHTV